MNEKESNIKMTGESLDISDQRKHELKQLFPGVFTEAKNDKGEVVETIDFEKLKAELGSFSDVYDGKRERYGMEWPGKRDCMKLIQQPSLATLKPCREESVDFDSTENLFIEGDNLEVLKLLQKSYYGKVKMIYIDPPYNTGKEFIYPDKYSESLETYMAYAGLVDDEGKKFATNTATEGRFHTKWLNMMYPRLYLARNLLREDGYFVASIDDAEKENFRRVLDEIFGEENFLATLVWDRNRKNDAKYFSVGHEYMLVYAKDKQRLNELEIILRASKKGVEDVKAEFERLKAHCSDDWVCVREELKQFFSLMEKDDPRKILSRFSKVDEKGPYRDDGNINWPGGGGPMYDIFHPITGELCKKPTSGWRYPTKERFDEEVSIGRIVFGDDESTVPRVRTNLFENATQVMSSVNYSYAQTASNEFSSIFQGKRLFDNPKSFRDMESLISYLCEDSSIVLDFFAGSCSFAHGAMLANLKDNVQHNFICVQLPEKCPDNSVAITNGYSTIADIGKERIRRAAKKIREAQESQLDLEGNSALDLGFKVLKLDKSNFKQWQSPSTEINAEQLGEQLELHTDHIDPYATQEEILYELLLKAGFVPTSKIDTLELAGKSVFSIDEGALLICLEDELTAELIDAVAELEPMQFICLDKGFNGNDQLKANAVQTFKSRAQNAEAEMVFKVV